MYKEWHTKIFIVSCYISLPSKRNYIFCFDATFCNSIDVGHEGQWSSEPISRTSYELIISFVKISFSLIFSSHLMKSQFCLCCHSLVVVTYAKSWHMFSHTYINIFTHVNTQWVELFISLWNVNGTSAAPIQWRHSKFRKITPNHFSQLPNTRSFFYQYITKISHISIDIRPWISNYIIMIMWHIIRNPWPNSNGVSIKRFRIKTRTNGFSQVFIYILIKTLWIGLWSFQSFIQ